jgi:tripartite-type tricarboxylate transporter receptor subunit TctC
VEQQVPITTFGWYGVCAGAGVPQPIIDVLNKHISDATSSKEYATLMQENGLTTAASSPEALGAIMKGSVSSTIRLMQVLGLPQID